MARATAASVVALAASMAVSASASGTAFFVTKAGNDANSCATAAREENPPREPRACSVNSAR